VRGEFKLVQRVTNLTSDKKKTPAPHSQEEKDHEKELQRVLETTGPGRPNVSGF